MRSTISRGSTWLARELRRSLAALGTLAALGPIAALGPRTLGTRAPGSLTPTLTLTATCRGAEVSEDGRLVDRGSGEALRRGGLNTRALSAWAGTDRISALPSLIHKLVPAEPTPAAAALALFVGGTRVPTNKLSLLGDSLAALAERGLVELDGDQARARVAIIPLGSSLFVCDRLDAPPSEDLVCWPDDSSHHLAACLPPGRRERWLDLGCGSGFAALARPELAAKICGTDINARALQHAALGVSLSGIALEVFDGDVGANVPASWRGNCELVSCNAPMPSVETIETSAEEGVRELDSSSVHAKSLPVWRHAPADVIERMVDAAERFAANGAMIVIHAAEDALATALTERGGERTIVRYTPDGVPGFAVAWWQPDGEQRFVRRARLLTPDAPHLTYGDRG